MSVGIIDGNVAGSYIISATLTPAATATITTVEQTFTSASTGLNLQLGALKVGDFVTVNPPSVTAGLAQTSARVSAAGTLAIAWCNPTAGSLTAPSGVYVIKVDRPERQTAATVISA
jgi:hypothetical protein